MKRILLMTAAIYIAIITTAVMPMQDPKIITEKNDLIKQIKAIIENKIIDIKQLMSLANMTSETLLPEFATHLSDIGAKDKFYILTHATPNSKNMMMLFTEWLKKDALLPLYTDGKINIMQCYLIAY